VITFVYASKFLCSREELFDFHEQPIGFQTLVGAAPGVKVLVPPPSLEVGSVAKMLVPILPLVWNAVWVAEHTAYKKNEFFEDTQSRALFARFATAIFFYEFRVRNASFEMRLN
jgi:ligand-binding SRPBCC domain-containing protein